MPDGAGASREERRSDAIACWGLPIVVGAIAWVGAYPPMGDLPLHESIAAMLLHRNDAGWAPSGLYLPSLGHPQQLVQLVMAAAMLILPSMTAAKLVVSLSIAGIVWSTARLLRHLGRTPWAAAAVAPLALGWLFNWGFLANLAGLAIFGVLAIEIDRLAERPSRSRAMRVAVGIAVAFLAHATVAVCGAVMLGIFVLVRRPPRGRMLLALSPTLVLAIALAVERQREQSEPTALARAFADHTQWRSPIAKLEELPMLIAGRYDLPITIAIVAAVAGALALLLHARRRELAPADVTERLVKHRFGLAAAALFVLFLVTPYSINYGAYLYARFLGPAWICLGAAVAPTRASFATKAVPVACLLASVFALVPEIQRAHQHHRMLAALYPQIAMGSAVAVVAYGKGDRSAWHPTTAGHRILAERGGRTLWSFAEYPTSPLTIAPASRWDALVLRVYPDPGALRPASDLDVVRYVLAWVPDDSLWPLLDRAFRPDARLIAREGEWLLFESTHLLRPITAPLPPETADTTTIQERVNAIVKVRQAPRAQP